MSNDAAECPKCGAPQRQGFVLCPFCRSPYSPELLRSAIPCPGCKEPSAWGHTRCIKCSRWIVVQCLFCNHLTPHNQPACLTCGEPFQGMAERKAQRDAQARAAQEQAQAAQRAQAVQTYGGVAASFLGSFAGAFVGSSPPGGSWFGGDSGPPYVPSPVDESFETFEDPGPYEDTSSYDDSSSSDDSYESDSDDGGSSDDSSW